MSEKEQLIVACDAAGKFPQNLTHHGAPEHTQTAYTRRLDEREDRLFCRDDGRTRLDMLEYDERTKRKWLDALVHKAGHRHSNWYPVLRRPSTLTERQNLKRIASLTLLC